jgi:hypothetical protein
MTIRRVKILKPWETYRVGDVIPELPQSSAELLVGRGFAEYLDEQVHRAPVDRMVRPARSRRQKAAPAA